MRRTSAVAAGLQAVTRRLNEHFLRFFLPCRREVRGPDPERTILRGIDFVAAVCRDRVLFATSPHAAAVPLTLAEVEDEAVRLLLGYLRAPER